MIPKTIQKEHILQAIEQVDNDGYDSKHKSTKAHMTTRNQKRVAENIRNSLLCCLL